MEAKTVQTQKVLCATNITLASHVINPYRGCSFGCLYCYARENKNMKKNTGVCAKVNAPELLKKELRYTNPKRVLLGSTTECFQHAEQTCKLSAQIIEILNQNNIPFTILTKSHMIADCLIAIAKNPLNKIYFTVNAARDETIRLFEPASPSLGERLEAIRGIISRGIALRVHIGPFIPYLDDIGKIIGQLPAGVKEADVELYHHKMGNFNAVLEKISSSCGKETAQDIRKVYSCRENYQAFSQSLKVKIKPYEGKMKIFRLVPDYDEYYNALDYGEPL